VIFDTFPDFAIMTMVFINFTYEINTGFKVPTRSLTAKLQRNTIEQSGCRQVYLN